MYLSWIIPAYNEEKRIEKTLREVDAYLRSKNFPGGYEIIVANSASKDKTAQITEGLKPQIQNLRILNLENKGKGWAVKRGMLEAKGDIRLFSDADNSTSPENFNAMELLFKQGLDMVISSRDPKDAAGASRDVEEPWYRELLGNMGNLVIQIVGGIWGIWDTQNGFKAMTAKSAESVFSRSQMVGFSFDIEVLVISRRLGFKIGIIPIRWKFDPDSKVTLTDYIRVFRDVFKIRLNLLTNVYKF